ncbi:hypothetical protein [Lacunimicrobium album]
MFIFGSGQKVVTVKPLGKRECPVCERTRPFSLLLLYTYFHLYYFFTWVTSRKYHATCDVCGNGAAIKRQKIEKHLDRDPLPFVTRFGCLLFPFAVFGVLMLMLLVLAIVDP